MTVDLKKNIPHWACNEPQFLCTLYINHITVTLKYSVLVHRQPQLGWEQLCQERRRRSGAQNDGRHSERNDRLGPGQGCVREGLEVTVH